jgi:TRAP-type C4-dicarboxylate transport system permease small subunit
MPRIFQRVSKVFSSFFAGGAALSMTAVFLIVFSNSLRRYSIGKSFEWGEELSVYIAIYGIMFGAAYAYMEDRHIKFTMLVGFLSEAYTRKLYMLVDLIIAASGVLLSYSGYLFVLQRGRVESSGMINLVKELKLLTGIDQILFFGLLYPYQAAMLIGGGLLTIAALLRLGQRIAEGSLPKVKEG